MLRGVVSVKPQDVAYELPMQVHALTLILLHADSACNNHDGHVHPDTLTLNLILLAANYHDAQCARKGVWGQWRAAAGRGISKERGLLDQSCTHQVGCGGLVLSSKPEILLIMEQRNSTTEEKENSKRIPKEYKLH